MSEPRSDGSGTVCSGRVDDNGYHCICSNYHEHNGSCRYHNRVFHSKAVPAEQSRFTEIREGVYEPTTVSNNKVDDARVTEIINHRFSHNHSAGSDYCPACMASSVAEQPRQSDRCQCEKPLVGPFGGQCARCDKYSDCSPVAASPAEGPHQEEICPSCRATDNNPYTSPEGIAMRACGRCMIQWRVAAPVPGAKAEGLLPEMPQEYGQEHPWKAFDEWHKQHHEGKYSWPCAHPLRCLWRYTRKTGALLNQRGNVAQTIPLPNAKVEEIAEQVASVRYKLSMSASHKEIVAAIADILRPYFPADAPLQELKEIHRLAIQHERVDPAFAKIRDIVAKLLK